MVRLPGVTGWLTVRRIHRKRRGMAIIATIMNSATGQPIQKMTFGRMPKPWASFSPVSYTNMPLPTKKNG